MSSKVYLTLLVPQEESLEVEEIKIIGEVLRVEELPSVNGNVVALGIEFKSIQNTDMSVLRGFLQKRLIAENMMKKDTQIKSKKDDAKTLKLDDSDDYASQHETSKMSFIDSLNINESWEGLFRNAFKWTFRIGVIALFFYFCYNTLILIMYLMQLR